MKINFKILSGAAFFFIISFYACNSHNENEEGVPVVKTAVKNVEEQQFDYLLEGKKIAENAQIVLGKNLMNAINSRGAEFAVTFCNIEAMPLTDSMAKVLGASLKRVSDKPRNAKNEANKEELYLIKMMKEEMQYDENPKPLIKEINGKMVGYYAIVTNAMCLKCHGDKCNY